MSPRPRLADRIGFLRSLSKGLARGAFFPDRGAGPPAPAPGGSAPPPRPRWGNGAGDFQPTTHRLTLAGLGRPLSIWHLTDIHIREQGPWLDALCAATAALPPADLVLLTGDLVTTGWRPAAARQWLASLPTGRLGRFAVLGNWEHWAGAATPAWTALLAEAGVQLLRNACVPAGPVDVLGTDDHLAGTLALGAPLRARRAGRPTIGLTHSPAAAPTLARCGIPLILAGHSHAGQVRLPWLGALWVPMGTGRYVGGWYPLGESQLFVGRGVGWSIAPVRLRCPPELARIELAPAP